MGSDFFESGGDSLKAVRIVAYLRAFNEERPELQIGKDFSALSATDILQHRTPRALLKSCLGSSLDVKGGNCHGLTQIVEIVPRTVPSHILEPGCINRELRAANSAPSTICGLYTCVWSPNYYTSFFYSRSFLKVYVLIVS